MSKQRFLKLPLKSDRDLTPLQTTALSVIRLLWVRSDVNKDCPAWQGLYKWVAGALNAPRKFDALVSDVNEKLRELKQEGKLTGEICHFKSGDAYIRYTKYPDDLSRETIRQAWVKSGFRDLQKEYGQLRRQFRLSH